MNVQENTPEEKATFIEAGSRYRSNTDTERKEHCSKSYIENSMVSEFIGDNQNLQAGAKKAFKDFLLKAIDRPYSEVLGPHGLDTVTQSMISEYGFLGYDIDNFAEEMAKKTLATVAQERCSYLQKKGEIKDKREKFAFNNLEFAFLMSQKELKLLACIPQGEKTDEILRNYESEWNHRAAVFKHIPPYEPYDNEEPLDKAGIYVLPEQALMSKALLDIPIILEMFRNYVAYHYKSFEGSVQLTSNGGFAVNMSHNPSYQDLEDLLNRLDLMFRSLFLSFYTPINMDKLNIDLSVLDAPDMIEEDQDISAFAGKAMERLKNPIGHYFSRREPLDGKSDDFSAGVRHAVKQILYSLHKKNMTPADILTPMGIAAFSGLPLYEVNDLIDEAKK